MLTAGERIGIYEIVSPLGAGGMGEVYRARDTKLQRDVALKILPETMARDAQRMARFEREAQVLASLNHPNIAAIYGLEESNGVRALVMELVGGETLGDKIVREVSSPPARSGEFTSPRGVPAPPLQIDEALPIAKQIAEGLEYAHERGVIHRDLKPANVKITPEGTVKVLDFGLAKVLDTQDSSATLDMANSPTLSSMATQAGIILGTVAYMSPEQAKGQRVDRRADIWAFGCVLYEMLTGQKPFEGESISDVLAAVIRAEPDWTAIPYTTPPSIQRLIRRCLQKDQRQRLQAIGEARIAIEETISGTGVPPVIEHGHDAHATRTTSSFRRVLPWAGLILFAAIAGLFAIGYFERAPQPGSAVVAQILPPPETSFALGGTGAGPPVLSPGGKKLAFVAVRSDGKQQIWMRATDSATAQALAGTEGATYPFWSPDGRSLGFFADGKLNRIDASGGPVIALCDAPEGRGGSWGADGTILFTPSARDVIYRVGASGGPPTAVTKHLVPGEVDERWPQLLPDGRHFLLYARYYAPGKSGTYVESLDGEETKLLIRGESQAVYAPPGYLLFIRLGTLMAERFDAENLRLAGNATPLTENGVVNHIVWRAIFTISDNGTLVYERGATPAGYSELLWYDRSGKQLRQTGTAGNYMEARLSPDETKLAVTVEGAEGNNIWVFDVARDVRTPLTFSSDNYDPAWSPDGKTIAFTSASGGLLHLYQKAADGRGKAEPLFVDDANEWFPEWSADGHYLVFDRAANAPAPREEIWAMPMFGNRKPFPVVQNSRFSVLGHALSPDGKWLAYSSFESGKPELHVQPFPAGGPQWLVSSDNSVSPRWRRDGKELFYFSVSNSLLMSAQVAEHGSNLDIRKAVPLFKTNAFVSSPYFLSPFDVSADGKGFVVSSQLAEQTSQPLTVIINWPALLKSRDE